MSNIGSINFIRLEFSSCMFFRSYANNSSSIIFLFSFCCIYWLRYDPSLSAFNEVSRDFYYEVPLALSVIELRELIITTGFDSIRANCFILMPFN
mgnify:CR=1 FL=1